MYPLLLLFLKDSNVLYLQVPKLCKMGKGTIRYGGYKVVLKISGEKKEAIFIKCTWNNLSNYSLCCFLLT